MRISAPWYIFRSGIARGMCILKSSAEWTLHTGMLMQQFPQEHRKVPSFDTRGIFSLFTFSTLVWEKNIAQCLIHASSPKEEANCTKTGSFAECLFFFLSSLLNMCIVVADFMLWYSQNCQVGIQWAVSRKVCSTGGMWMDENILYIAVI